MGTRSLMRYAAGKPVVSVMNPSTRNAHATPRACRRPFVTKLIMAPPRPPPAKTMPLAIPLLALKYCAGVTDTTYGCHLNKHHSRFFVGA